MSIPESLRVLTDWSKELGGLEASAIWALVCIGLYYRLWASDKHHEQYDKSWQEIRTKEAISDSRMADAMVRMSETVERHCQETGQIRLILDERIPRGERNVRMDEKKTT